MGRRVMGRRVMGRGGGQEEKAKRVMGWGGRAILFQHPQSEDILMR